MAFSDESRDNRDNRNGGQPCKNCLDHGEQCESATRQRPRVKRKDNANTEMAQRLAMLESFVQSLSSSSPKPDGYHGSFEHSDQMNSSEAIFTRHPSSMRPGSTPRATSFGQRSELPPLISEQCAPSPNANELAPRRNLDYEKEMAANAFPSPCTNPSVNSLDAVGLDSLPIDTLQHRNNTKSRFFNLIHDGNVPAHSQNDHVPRARMAAVQTPEEEQEGNGVYHGEMSNWEYHGPRSYLSICSKPAILWVASKTGSDAFQVSASRFTQDITRRLKMEHRMSKERTVEPALEAAQRYAQAYFESAPEAPFGFVDRAAFESRLQNDFHGSMDEDDPAWYALRHAIYATGARIELSRTHGFREACQTACNFFSNAFSVHTELLYFRTSLMATQALTVMAYFTDSIGSPCLEYMLSTVALRLACSKGMHRRAVSSWNISEQERSYRNRVFWALYCLEKNSACRSGRPSMIDDGEISCDLPAADASSTAVNVTYSTILIRLAQMVSVVMRKNSTIEAFYQPLHIMAAVVAELDERKKTLKEFLTQYISLDTPMRPPECTVELSAQQTVYIRLSYYNIVLGIHSVLTNPWSRCATNFEDHLGARRQLEKSREIVALTSRNAILASQYIHIDATTPLVLSFYGPICALVNLLIYVLDEPNHPTIQSDLALMDIGAAHFSRVLFATELSLSFPKDVAALARTAIRRQKGLAGHSFNLTDNSSEMSGMQHAPAVPDGGVEFARDDLDAAFKDAQNSVAEFFDFEPENLSTFMPPPSFDDDLSGFVSP